jgi:Domain of unknown function (DUF4234)
VTHEVTIAGGPCRAKVRDPWMVVGLSVVTLGIYTIYWWYEINRELRDFGYLRSPG